MKPYLKLVAAVILRSSIVPRSDNYLNSQIESPTNAKSGRVEAFDTNGSIKNVSVGSLGISYRHGSESNVFKTFDKF